jgi:collagen triple helix repeat protein
MTMHAQLTLISRTASVVAVAAVLVVPATLSAQDASAAAAAADAVIAACSVPGSRTLYKADASGACAKASHEKVSWNQVGPKGDAGAAGPQGAAGPAGEAGAKGDKGDAGAAGAAGAQGDPGAAGAQGAPGAAGLKGDKGDVGPVGPAGAGFVWRGEWTEREKYEAGSVVHYDGSAYVATREGPASKPDPRCETEKCAWSLLARQGGQGIQGVQGIQGIQGIQGPSGLPCTSCINSGSIADGAVTLAKVSGMPGVEFVGISYTNLNVRTSAVNVGSVTLTVPAAGFVVVRVDGMGYAATGDRLVLAASNVSQDYGVNDGVALFEGDGNAHSITHTRVYSVSAAGSYTFYAVAHNTLHTSGNGLASIYATLTGTFYPIRY